MIDRDSRRLAVLGGIAGLLGAGALGSLRFFGDDGPRFAEGVFGDTVFALVYLSPYALTLAASRTSAPAARGGLLMALGTLSLVASISAFSLVTVILLPATGAIFLAAAWSLRAPGRRIQLAPPYFAAGSLCAAVVILSFVALFAFEADESRCWTLTNNAQGTREWRPGPDQVGSDRITIALGPGDISTSCTSDIITNSEGLRAFAILSVGVLVFIAAAYLPAPGGRHGR